MKFQPKAGTPTNDVVYTPDNLAKDIYNYFKPRGLGLEPCRGGGAFYNLMCPNADWCEIQEGRDFFAYNQKVDYIMTNPPWSQIRGFLCHSMDLANDIYFLMTINHAFTKARVRDATERGFYIADILLLDTPKEFPQSGFQLGVVHWRKGNGVCNITRL